MFETIVALATAPFKAALHIIRLSGDEAFAIASKMLKKDITTIDKKTIKVGDIYSSDDEVIDNVVCLIYKGPKSFTGEDVVEFICHGSMLIVNEIIALAMKYGARQAERGEFSQRAYLSNKIDLVQAEAIADVIDATTHEAKALALLSLEGDTSKLFAPLKKKIEDLICAIEVHFDYPEEADEEMTDQIIINQTKEMIEDVNSLLNASYKGHIIKDGVKVALVGKPNVGKSSILNALLNEDKAIVTPIAGTTRDIVEGDINLDGITLHLLDTAGIRQSEDEIETIGITKSKQTIEAADLVIVVLDASKTSDEYDQEILEFTKDKNRIIVFNKADKLSSEINKDGLFISALNKDIEPLKKEIFHVLGISSNDFNTPSLANARQIGLLEQIKSLLLTAKHEAETNVPIDLVSVGIRQAYNRAKELIGEDPDLDISGEIFKRFCVGK